MQEAAALDGNGEQGDTYFQVSLMATLAKKSATAPPTIARMPEDIEAASGRCACSTC